METGKIVGFYAGSRGRKGAKGLWNSLPPKYRQCAVIYTDFWEAYVGVLPSKRHRRAAKNSGKTSHIERFNNTLRQRISRLVRKTLSFSKKLENHIGAVLLFILYYNNMIEKEITDTIGLPKNDNVKRKSPLTLSLQHGNYEIVIKKDGYYEENKQVQLEKGKQIQLSVNLRKIELPEQKGIVINTVPQEADISINNQYKGKSRLEISLQIGEYEVRIRRDGYYEEKTKIRIEKEGKGIFDIPLKPIPVLKDDSAEKLQRACDFVEDAYEESDDLCRDLKEISVTHTFLKKSKSFRRDLTKKFEKQVNDLEENIRKKLGNYRDAFKKVNESFEKYKQKGKVSSKIYEQVRNHFNQYVQTGENFQRWRDDLKNICCDSTG